MMKTLAGIAAAALMTTGLSVAASAATPYPPTVKTSVTIKAPTTKLKVKQKATLTVIVKAIGTAAPKSGKIKLTFQRKVKGKWRKVTKAEKNRLTASRKYRGKPAPMTIGWFKKRGTYRAVATFTPAPGTVFKPTTKALVLKVK